MKSTIIGNESQVKQPTFECGELVRGKDGVLVILCDGSHIYPSQSEFSGMVVHGNDEDPIGTYSKRWYSHFFELCPLPLVLKFDE